LQIFNTITTQVIPLRLKSPKEFCTINKFEKKGTWETKKKIKRFLKEIRFFSIKKSKIYYKFVVKIRQTYFSLATVKKQN